MCVARNPTICSKQIASLVGITERQVYKIISDLEEWSHFSTENRTKKSLCSRYRCTIETPD